MLTRGLPKSPSIFHLRVGLGMPHESPSENVGPRCPQPPLSRWAPSFLGKPSPLKALSYTTSIQHPCNHVRLQRPPNPVGICTLTLKNIKRCISIGHITTCTNPNKHWKGKSTTTTTVKCERIIQNSILQWSNFTNTYITIESMHMINKNML